MIKEPFQFGDRVRTPSGWGKITGFFDVDKSRLGWFEVTMESLFGRVVALPPEQLRHERFIDFCNRPTGFGRTPWGQFWIIQAAIVALVVLGMVTWRDGGWTAVVGAVLVEAVFVFGTYMNYTRKWV